MMYNHIHCTKSASFQSLPLVSPLSLSLCNQHVREHDSIGLNYVFPDIFQNRQWIIPKNDPKCSMRHTHDVTRKKSQNVGWGWCWLRDVGLQINTNTTRSRAWKFLKFVFRCSVLVPNRWMWSSEHIIVGCFCISQHPLLNFLLVEETLPLWQSWQCVSSSIAKIVSGLKEIWSINSRFFFYDFLLLGERTLQWLLNSYNWKGPRSSSFDYIQDLHKNQKVDKSNPGGDSHQWMTEQSQGPQPSLPWW